MILLQGRNDSEHSLQIGGIELNLKFVLRNGEKNKQYYAQMSTNVVEGLFHYEIMLVRPFKHNTEFRFAERATEEKYKLVQFKEKASMYHRPRMVGYCLHSVPGMIPEPDIMLKITIFTEEYVI